MALLQLPLALRMLGLLLRELMDSKNSSNFFDSSLSSIISDLQEQRCLNAAQKEHRSNCRALTSSHLWRFSLCWWTSSAWALWVAFKSKTSRRRSRSRLLFKMASLAFKRLIQCDKDSQPRLMTEFDEETVKVESSGVLIHILNGLPEKTASKTDWNAKNPLEDGSSRSKRFDE